LSPIAAKTYTTDVICLRTYDYGEADKILHLFSPEYGRISAIAKGVKKANSKMSGASEVLNLSEVQLTKGKNLDVLCQYQPRETFIGVRSDLLKLAYALLMAELVDRNTGDQAADSQQTFTLLKGSLMALDQANEPDIVPLAIECQMALLHAAGFHPVLNACVLSGKPLEENSLFYCFSPELGGMTMPDTRKRQQMQTSDAGMNWVNVSGTTLRILNAPHSAHWEIAQLMKAQRFLQYYFKQVFERPLHSYNLIFNLLEMTSASKTKSPSTIQNLA
jgi:DNA repair protein RecO (recombination protein O)